MITVFHSSQRAMAKAALRKRLKEDGVDTSSVDYVEFDLSSTPSQELAFECESLSLSFGKKTVVGTDAYFLEKKSKSKPPKDEDKKFLLEYLANPNPDVDLYFLVYADEIDTKNEYFALLDNVGAKIINVASLSDQEWIKYIISFFKKKGIIIDNDAAYEFLSRFEGDYSSFLSYSEKLSSYAIDSKHLSKKDIQELVSAPLEENVFLLSNALLKGNKKEALRIYEDLKVTSVEEISLLNLLGSQFRILNQVNILSRHERRSNEEIASLLKISPGRVRACLGNLYNMNDETCPEALEGIYEAEKNILTGKVEPRIAFSLFIINFKLRP